MEWFQQTDAEQNQKVNGCTEPPEGESGGSDSCGGTSVSEVTDLQELKTHESESEAEEDKEEREEVPASKVHISERKEKKSVDEEEHKQNHSAASTYTGDLSRSASSSDAS